jgi:transposase
MGRPLKLTPTLQDKICNAIAAGSYSEIAARYAGVSSTTFYKWMALGDGDNAESPYREFREAVENARATSEVRNIGLIQQAANNGTWQAAAWYLERTSPARWGRRSALEVSGTEGGAIRIDVSIDELETKVAKLLPKE